MQSDFITREIGGGRKNRRTVLTPIYFMATIIDSLIISLGLDTGGVSQGMRKAESSLQTGVKHIMGNILAPLAGALAFGGLLKNYIASADAAGKLASSIGVDSENMQAWGEAAARSGGSADAFYSSLSSVNDKMIELTKFGGGPAALVLAQLGISARDSSGKVKSSVDIMKDLASVSDKMDKREFASIAKKFGIDDGTLKLLQQGSLAVDTLVKRQKELGVYTQKDFEVTSKAAGAFADLLQSFKAVAASILRILLPAITWLAEKFTTMVTFLRSHETFLIAIIAGVAGAITALLLPSIIKIGAAMLANPLTWIFIGIAAAILAVAAIIDDLYVYMKGGNSALAGFWSMFGSGEEIAAKLNAVWTKTKEILGYIFDIAKALFPYVIAIVGNVLSVVGSLIMFLANLWNYFKALFAFDSSALSDAFDGLAVSIYNIFASVGKLISSFLDLVGLKDVLLAAWETVRDFFVGFLDWLSEKLSAILDIPGKIKDKIGGFAEGILNFFGGDKNDKGSLPPISSADAVSSSVVNNKASSIQTENKVNVGSVVIQTSATDAAGIANAIPGAIDNSFNKNLIMAANTGVIQK